MDEPCETCRMTVSSITRIVDQGSERMLVETGGPSAFDLADWPQHTPKRCRAARYLRNTAEGILDPGDRVDVVPGSLPGSRPDDHEWLQLRAARRHDDGRLVSGSWNVNIHPDVIEHAAVSTARRLRDGLNARAVGYAS